MTGFPRLDFSMNEAATEDGLIVSLSGDLDVSAAEEVIAALRRHLAAEPRVVIDLTEVVFMDSSGLGAIVMSPATDEQRAKLTLRPSRHPQPQQLLRVTGMLDHFGVSG